MMGVAIYLEGGGDGSESRAQLRRGMDAFLGEIKDAARAKAMRWKMVACGGRQQAHDAFVHTPLDPEFPIRVLLVDAEGPVSTTRIEHLRRRDSWPLSGAEESAVHLMTQTMEAWIVADPDELSKFYGPNFRKSALPMADNLETVAKQDLTAGLERATQRTTKGKYHKIRHIHALLSRIDASKARARCRHCEAVFSELTAAIAAA